MRINRTIPLAAAAAALAIAAPAGPAHADLLPPFGDAPDHGAIEVVCEARGGWFFVNTYSGRNLICSAASHVGGWTAEQAQCRLVGGEFWSTPIYDGFGSWGCRIEAP